MEDRPITRLLPLKSSRRRYPRQDSNQHSPCVSFLTPWCLRNRLFWTVSLSMLQQFKEKTRRADAVACNASGIRWITLEGSTVRSKHNALHSWLQTCTQEATTFSISSSWMTSLNNRQKELQAVSINLTTSSWNQYRVGWPASLPASRFWSLRIAYWLDRSFFYSTSFQTPL